MEKYKIITLCGSTKFKDEFIEAEKELSNKEYLVFSVAQYTHADKIEISEKQRRMFDKMHREKIKLSDAIYVINVNDYIGESTQQEIEYAKSLGKEVYYRYLTTKDNQQPSIEL